MESLDHCLDKAVYLAKQAGDAALFYYHKEYEVTDKGKDDPVTEADHASNKVIVEGLKEQFDHGILSEETEDDHSRRNNKRVWIVDPLDGTKDFIDKTGDFSIMIGLAEEGESVLGVVYKPDDGSLYYAIQGRGAFKKIGSGAPERIHVSSRNKFEDMVLLTSRFHASNTVTKAARELGIENTLTRGSAGLKLCSIAEGKADVNINPSNKTWEWDVCAADVILSEAGGKLTDVFENKITYNKEDPRNKQGYIGSNDWRHYEIIEEVRKNYEV